MKLIIEKDKAEIRESINGRCLEIELSELDFIGAEGGLYRLLDENGDAVDPDGTPSPNPIVVPNPYMSI